MICATCKDEINVNLQYITKIVSHTNKVKSADFCCGLCETIFTLKELIENQKHFDILLTLSNKFKLDSTWYPVINQLRDQLIKVRGL